MVVLLDGTVVAKWTGLAPTMKGMSNPSRFYRRSGVCPATRGNRASEQQGCGPPAGEPIRGAGTHPSGRASTAGRCRLGRPGIVFPDGLLAITPLALDDRSVRNQR